MDERHFAVILAAGKGTRMRSSLPKVLQTMLGETMLGLVLAAARPIFGKNILIVSGHGAEMLYKHFPNAAFIRQERQLGTGHALQIAMPALMERGATHAAIINGDAPLIQTADIDKFLAEAAGADIAFATISPPDIAAYGRVVRRNGAVAAIIEAKDYNPAMHGEPSGEANAGLYQIKCASIAPLLPKLDNSNRNGEFYITDLIGLAAAAGLKVNGIACGDDPALLGVNTPAELAAAEDMLAMRVANGLLQKGAIIHWPQMLRASPLAAIEPGVEICCPCAIYGASHIHAGATIGQHCVIIDSEIHSGARIRPFSHIEKSIVGENAIVGPYTRLRPGARLDECAHAGNFVELKNARLGACAKANHLSYLGDAEIGPGANIGAGSITCNYDGHSKHKTFIGAQAFIGSNTALVAPVSVGANALVGAGSTITKDVPEDEMGIARARQKNMPRRKL